MIKSRSTLFKKILTDGKLENKMFSPLSLQLALDMLSKVEELGLEQELRELLDSMNFSKDAALKMIEELADSPSTVLVRNSFWMREDIPLKPIDYEGCDFFKEDFKSKKTKNKVNAWVNESTNGLIKKIDIDFAQNLGLIINALYLNCEWVIPFPTPEWLDEFQLLNGKKIESYFLWKSKEETIYHYESTHFQAVGLPYKDKRLRFEIYFPSKERGFEDFLNELDQMDIHHIGNQFDEVDDYVVSFPKFDMKTEYGFKNMLDAAGYGDVFNAGLIDEIQHN